MSAAHFERFRRSFLGDGREAARDGLDLDALAGLDDGERSMAEAILLGRLALDDDRAAAGLGALRTERAAPLLREKMDALRGDAATPSAQRLLTVALALWQVAEDRDAFDAMVEVLQRCPIFTIRRAAAEALGGVHLPESAQALLAAQLDGEGLVRHAAALSLLRLHGVPTSPPPALVWEVMSADPAVRERATRDLVSAVLARPDAAP